MLSIADKVHLGESTVGEWVGEFVTLSSQRHLLASFPSLVLSFFAGGHIGGGENRGE